MAVNEQGLSQREVNGTLVPAGTSPIALSGHIQGGLRTIASETELLDLSGQHAQDGMLIYRSDLSEYYKFNIGSLTRDPVSGDFNRPLTTDDFELVQFGGGSGGGQIFAETTNEDEFNSVVVTAVSGTTYTFDFPNQIPRDTQVENEQARLFLLQHVLGFSDSDQVLSADRLPRDVSIRIGTGAAVTLAANTTRVTSGSATATGFRIEFLNVFPENALGTTRTDTVTFNSADTRVPFNTIATNSMEVDQNVESGINTITLTDNIQRSADTAITLDNMNDVVLNSDLGADPAMVLRDAIGAGSSSRQESDRYHLNNGRVVEWSQEDALGNVEERRAGIATLFSADRSEFTVTLRNNAETPPQAIGITAVFPSGAATFLGTQANPGLSVGETFIAHVTGNPGFNVHRATMINYTTRTVETEFLCQVNDAARITTVGMFSTVIPASGTVFFGKLDDIVRPDPIGIPEWQSNIRYTAPNDLVSYNGRIYRLSAAAPANTTPTDADGNPHMGWVDIVSDDLVAETATLQEDVLRVDDRAGNEIFSVDNFANEQGTHVSFANTVDFQSGLQADETSGYSTNAISHNSPNAFATRQDIYNAIVGERESTGIAAGTGLGNHRYTPAVGYQTAETFTATSSVEPFILSAETGGVASTNTPAASNDNTLARSQIFNTGLFVSSIEDHGVGVRGTRNPNDSTLILETAAQATELFNLMTTFNLENTGSIQRLRLYRGNSDEIEIANITSFAIDGTNDRQINFVNAGSSETGSFPTTPGTPFEISSFRVSTATGGESNFTTLRFLPEELISQDSTRPFLIRINSTRHSNQDPFFNVRIGDTITGANNITFPVVGTSEDEMGALRYTSQIIVASTNDARNQGSNLNANTNISMAIRRPYESFGNIVHTIEEQDPGTPYLLLDLATEGPARNIQVGQVLKVNGYHQVDRLVVAVGPQTANPSASNHWERVTLSATQILLEHDGGRPVNRLTQLDAASRQELLRRIDFIDNNPTKGVDSDLSFRSYSLRPGYGDELPNIGTNAARINAALAANDWDTLSAEDLRFFSSQDIVSTDGQITSDINIRNSSESNISLDNFPLQVGDIIRFNDTLMPSPSDLLVVTSLPTNTSPYLANSIGIQVRRLTTPGVTGASARGSIINWADLGLSRNSDNPQQPRRVEILRSIRYAISQDGMILGREAYQTLSTRRHKFSIESHKIHVNYDSTAWFIPAYSIDIPVDRSLRLELGYGVHQDIRSHSFAIGSLGYTAYYPYDHESNLDVINRASQTIRLNDVTGFRYLNMRTIEEAAHMPDFGNRNEVNTVIDRTDSILQTLAQPSGGIGPYGIVRGLTYRITEPGSVTNWRLFGASPNPGGTFRGVTFTSTIDGSELVNFALVDGTVVQDVTTTSLQDIDGDYDTLSMNQFTFGSVDNAIGVSSYGPFDALTNKQNITHTWTGWANDVDNPNVNFQLNTRATDLQQNLLTTTTYEYLPSAGGFRYFTHDRNNTTDIQDIAYDEYIIADRSTPISGLPLRDRIGGLSPSVNTPVRFDSGNTFNTTARMNIEGRTRAARSQINSSYELTLVKDITPNTVNLFPRVRRISEGNMEISDQGPITFNFGPETGVRHDIPATGNQSVGNVTITNFLSTPTLNRTYEYHRFTFTDATNATRFLDHVDQARRFGEVSDVTLMYGSNTAIIPSTASVFLSPADNTHVVVGGEALTIPAISTPTLLTGSYTYHAPIRINLDRSSSPELNYHYQLRFDYNGPRVINFTDKNIAEAVNTFGLYQLNSSQVPGINVGTGNRATNAILYQLTHVEATVQVPPLLTAYMGDVDTRIRTGDLVDCDYAQPMPNGQEDVQFTILNYLPNEARLTLRNTEYNDAVILTATPSDIPPGTVIQRGVTSTTEYTVTGNEGDLYLREETAGTATGVTEANFTPGTGWIPVALPTTTVLNATLNTPTHPGSSDQNPIQLTHNTMLALSALTDVNLEDTAHDSTVLSQDDVLTYRNSAWTNRTPGEVINSGVDNTGNVQFTLNPTGTVSASTSALTTPQGDTLTSKDGGDVNDADGNSQISDQLLIDGRPIGVPIVSTLPAGNTPAERATALSEAGANELRILDTPQMRAQVPGVNEIQTFDYTGTRSNVVGVIGSTDEIIRIGLDQNFMSGSLNDLPDSQTVYTSTGNRSLGIDNAVNNTTTVPTNLLRLSLPTTSGVLVQDQFTDTTAAAHNRFTLPTEITASPASAVNIVDEIVRQFNNAINAYNANDGTGTPRTGSARVEFTLATTFTGAGAAIITATHNGTATNFPSNIDSAAGVGGVFTIRYGDGFLDFGTYSFSTVTTEQGGEDPLSTFPAQWRFQTVTPAYNIPFRNFSDNLDAQAAMMEIRTAILALDSTWSTLSTVPILGTVQGTQVYYYDFNLGNIDTMATFGTRDVFQSNAMNVLHRITEERQGAPGTPATIGTTYTIRDPLSQEIVSFTGSAATETASDLNAVIAQITNIISTDDFNPGFDVVHDSANTRLVLTARLPGPVNGTWRIDVNDSGVTAAARGNLAFGSGSPRQDNTIIYNAVETTSGVNIIPARTLPAGLYRRDGNDGDLFDWLEVGGEDIVNSVAEIPLILLYGDYTVQRIDSGPNMGRQGSRTYTYNDSTYHRVYDIPNARQVWYFGGNLITSGETHEVRNGIILRDGVIQRLFDSDGTTFIGVSHSSAL